MDHIDNNRLNNKLNNLRWASHQENQMNSSISSKNTSGVKGVYYDKTRNKWVAQISIDGTMKNIGRYDNIEDAIIAR